jgi:hypothetical protein
MGLCEMLTREGSSFLIMAHTRQILHSFSIVFIMFITILALIFFPTLTAETQKGKKNLLLNSHLVVASCKKVTCTSTW